MSMLNMSDSWDFSLYESRQSSILETMRKLMTNELFDWFIILDK